MIGCELELGDVDTCIILPGNNKWDYKDGSIMNSNGTANDPKKKFNRYGGEIQVEPKHSPQELLKEVEMLLNIFKNKAVNFTTNLHVHISVPGLDQDLKMLKTLLKYIDMYTEDIVSRIDSIPVPKYGASIGEQKRYKRRQRSHHYILPIEKYFDCMSATTPEQFFVSMCTKNWENKPQWQLFVRPAINLASLIKHGTIEFRCFTMGFDSKKLLSSFILSKLIIEDALGPQQGIVSILKNNPELIFQSFWDYEEEKDQVFQLTNVYHNTRTIVQNNYEMLIQTGRIKKEELE